MPSKERYGLVLLGGNRPLDRGFPHSESQKQAWQRNIPKHRKLVAEYAEKVGIKAFYTLLGHGSVNQIKSMEALSKDLQPLIDSLNAEHGFGQWGILYGGDPANDAKPDIGAVARHFSQKGARVLAVQCDEYAQYMIQKPKIEGEAHKANPPLSWDWLDAAIIYKTERKKDGSILFGGYDTTNPLHHLVGATRYIVTLFGPEDRGSRQEQFLKGEIICGGGPISVHEHSDFFRRGYPCYYMPTEAKVRVVDSDLRTGESELNKYGIMHAWFADTGIPARMWAVLDQGTDTYGNDKNLVGWVAQEKESLGPLDVNEHDKYKLPLKIVDAIRKGKDPNGWWPRDKAPGRLVLLQESIQKDIYIMFKIKRVFDIKEKENEVGLHFEFSALIECPVLNEAEQQILEIERDSSLVNRESNSLLKQLVAQTKGTNEELAGFGFAAHEDTPSDKPGRVSRNTSGRHSIRGVGSAAPAANSARAKWDVYIPQLEFVNAANITFNGEDGWHADKLEKEFQYVEQTDPCGEKRAFRLLHGDFVGNFMVAMDLGNFPFDTQLIQIKLSTAAYEGDIEKFRFVQLKHPVAVMLGSAGLSIPSWDLLVFKEKITGSDRFDPWCGATMDYTSSDPSTGLSHRTVTCTFAVSRRPNSVVLNIGVPTFMLTLGMMLIYTIPVADGEIKDERINVAFVVFLSFIALKIVVMDMLPQLPYVTLIEEYILAALAFVALVSGHNSIMLWVPGIKDDEDAIRAADRRSLIFSGVLWVLLHAWVLFRWRLTKKALGLFLADNNLEVGNDTKIAKYLTKEKKVARDKRIQKRLLTKRVNVTERFPRKLMSQNAP